MIILYHDDKNSVASLSYGNLLHFTWHFYLHDLIWTLGQSHELGRAEGVTLFVGEKNEAKTEVNCPQVQSWAVVTQISWILCLNRRILVLDSRKSPVMFSFRIYFGYSFNKLYYLVSNLLEIRIINLGWLVSASYIANSLCATRPRWLRKTGVV